MAAGPARPGHSSRMTDAEALMWQAERNPGMRSAFSSVTFLDRAPDVARFRQRMARAVVAIPRLRQRVVDIAGGWVPPAWADDEHFDLDFHVRHLALPAPATRRQLLDLAALLHEEVFDPSRPLWQFTVVEGLEGDEAALIAKLHHTISDGIGAIRLSAMFTDIEPDPDRSAETAPAAAGAVGPPAGGAVVMGMARRPLLLGAQLASAVVGAVTHPAGAARTAVAVARQGVVTDSSRSPLWTGRHSVLTRVGRLRA